MRSIDLVAAEPVDGQLAHALGVLEVEKVAESWKDHFTKFPREEPGLALEAFWADTAIRLAVEVECGNRNGPLSPLRIHEALKRWPHGAGHRAIVF